MSMQNLSGLRRSQPKCVPFRENHFSIISIGNLDLIPKADHHFLFYGNAPAFISPESSFRLQHMEVSNSILHFFIFQFAEWEPFSDCECARTQKRTHTSIKTRNILEHTRRIMRLKFIKQGAHKSVNTSKIIRLNWPSSATGVLVYWAPWLSVGEVQSGSSAVLRNLLLALMMPI